MINKETLLKIEFELNEYEETDFYGIGSVCL